MMEAYGFDEPAIGDLTRTARLEKEFAEKCLRGEGPTQQELTITGDLRAVLLKEIGLIPEPDYVDEDTGERIPIPATPWLMGDWVRMAKLIIHYAELEENNENDLSKWTPDDMVRLWPIDTDAGVGGWNRESTIVEEEGTDRYECFIKTFDGKMKERNRRVLLQALGTEHRSYTWLILPEGPSKLTSIREKGISRNLWTGLPYPPGTSQVSGSRD
tara:strand:- start:93 stop:737 length:645 start_codon:yes stop_codon:yes gene_type:complete